jgi:hypothetical protein
MLGNQSTLGGGLGYAWHNVDNSKFIQDFSNMN